MFTLQTAVTPTGDTGPLSEGCGWPAQPMCRQGHDGGEGHRSGLLLMLGTQVDVGLVLSSTRKVVQSAFEEVQIGEMWDRLSIRILWTSTSWMLVFIYT